MADPAAAARPTVVVVDPDEALRRLVRIGLEIEGATVLEAASAAQARRLLSRERAAAQVRGVVVSPDLPDEDGCRLVGELDRDHPDVRVVLLHAGDEAPPEVAPVAVRRDVEGVIDALRLPPQERRPLSAGAIVTAGAAEIVALWRELCAWDPMLPPEFDPPHASTVVSAVGAALERPQPLGWGPDPDIERAGEVFALATGAIDTGVGSLVCLREAIRRFITGRVPSDEAVEAEARVDMIIDRAIGVVVARVAGALEQQAYVDALTGLLNRRAFERDLRRELGRAGRYDRRVTVVVIDLDGLKRVNDIEGHAMGDARLRALGSALDAGLRIGDGAYRIGGDEFVVLLPELEADAVAGVADRMRSAGAPPFSWGAASFPEDGDDPAAILSAADARLYDQRRQRRGA